MQMEDSPLTNFTVVRIPSQILYQRRKCKVGTTTNSLKRKGNVLSITNTHTRYQLNYEQKSAYFVVKLNMRCGCFLGGPQTVNRLKLHKLTFYVSSFYFCTNLLSYCKINKLMSVSVLILVIHCVITLLKCSLCIHSKLIGRVSSKFEPNIFLKITLLLTRFYCTLLLQKNPSSLKGLVVINSWVFLDLLA